MNDIDFIKKCCEYADGFDYDDDCFISYRNEWYTLKSIGYEMLLQRAIEGVNRKIKFQIYQHKNSYEISVNTYWQIINTVYFNNEIGSIDRAKRKALEYVFKQEENSD